MPTVNYTGPRLIQVPGIDSFTPRNYFLAQNASFREGDFLQMVTTGTIVGPAIPSSTLATAAGPVAANVTLGTSAQAGALATTYYIANTYTAAGPIESALGQVQVFSVAAGFVPTVSVASAGAPATATNFATYIGLSPNNLALQQATKTTSALGATYTVPQATLTNSIGVNRGASNMNSNIVGIAACGSDALYGFFLGGSGQAGLVTNVLGAAVSVPSLGLSPDPGQALVFSLINGAPFEINLKQPYTDALLGATAGFALDTAVDVAGIFIADTSQGNKPITLTAHPFGPSLQGVSSYLNPLGGVGDTGARVAAFLNAGAI